MQPVMRAMQFLGISHGQVLTVVLWENSHGHHWTLLDLRDCAALIELYTLLILQYSPFWWVKFNLWKGYYTLTRWEVVKLDLNFSSFKFFHLKDAQKAITWLPRTFMEGKLYNIVIFCQSECTNRSNFCILPLNFAVFWIKELVQYEGFQVQFYALSKYKEKNFIWHIFW